MTARSALNDAQRTPPKGVAVQAQRGLDLRERHGRGGTEVGVRRARQLADRRTVSDKDIKDIYSYFARHTVDKAAEGWGSRANPSAGYIAWLLWGGDPAQRWIGRLHDRLEKADA